MSTANAPMWAPRQQARRPSDGEAVVIIDIDQFAAIRQRHGDTAVDQVSLAVAEQLRHLLRPQDRLALVGNEAFMAVMPGVDSDALADIQSRLMCGVESMRIALSGAHWQLSCLTGGAARGLQRIGLDGVVRAADNALYDARRRRGARSPV
jgi:diguanylate cyclase (GGDEF)-like protein